MLLKDVTDLAVYTTSLELLKELYLLLEKLPKSEFDTCSQSKRCGKSIPANIAEGFAKRFYEKEFKRFLLIALGSSDELVTHLRTISITLPHLQEESEVLGRKYKVLSMRINKLHSSWNLKGYYFIQILKLPTY